MRRRISVAAVLLCCGIAAASGYWQSIQQVSVGAPAIAFVGAADGGNNGGSTASLTFSYTVGSGANRLLSVCVTGDTTVDDVTGATYNGVSMSLIAKIQATAGTRWSYSFYLLAPASGAHNVVISAGSSHFLLAGAADYSGVNASGQPDATATNSINIPASSMSTSVTTVANNDWAILCENGFSSGPPTAGAGSTVRAVDAAFGTWGIFDSNGPITPAGSYSMTTGYGSVSDITHVIGAFKP